LDRKLQRPARPFSRNFIPSIGKGRTPAKGDIFKNPALAKTLRLIGEKGRDAFYKGEIADKIDNSCGKTAAFYAKQILRSHTSTWGRSGLDELPRLRCV